MANPLRFFRVLEILIPGTIALVGVLVFAGGHWQGVFFLAFALLALSLFEWRLRSHRRNVTRIQAELEEIGRKFDAPAAVSTRGPGEHLESVASNPRFAAMIARRSTRMFVRGTWQGRDVELGTTIVAARDSDQMVSYACIPDAKPRPQFRAMTKGTLAKLARLGTSTHPVATGDEAFDDGWIVDADEATCRAVLDAGLRARLVELQAQVAWMQVASVEATSVGLVVRRPGELTPASAAHLRDLAIAVHDRIAALP